MIFHYNGWCNVAGFVYAHKTNILISKDQNHIPVKQNRGNPIEYNVNECGSHSMNSAWLKFPEMP